MFEEKVKKIIGRFLPITREKAITNKILLNINQTLENELRQGKSKKAILTKIDSELANLNDILSEIETEKNTKIKNKLLKDILQILELKLVNQFEVNVHEISEIHLNYHLGDLIILPSPTDQIKVFDFMSRDISKLYSLIEKIGNVIRIQQGPRKLVGIFKNKVIITLPTNYAGFLTIKTQSGKIYLSNLKSHCMLDLTTNSGNILINKVAVQRIQADVKSSNIILNDSQSNEYHINSHSGNIQASYLSAIAQEQELSFISTAGNIKLTNIKNKHLILETKSGNIIANNLNSPSLDLQTHTGNTKISNFISSGQIKSELGKVTLNLAPNYSGQLDVHTTTGNITLKVPSKLAFNFETRTSLGTIQLPMDAIIYGNDDFSQMDGYLVKSSTTTKIDLSSDVGKIEIQNS